MTDNDRKSTSGAPDVVPSTASQDPSDDSMFDGDEARTVDGDVFDPHTVGESVTAPNTTPEYDGRP